MMIFKRSFSLFAIVPLTIVMVFSCSRPEPLEIHETEEYKRAVSDFYVSLGASQTDETRFAFNKMNDVAQAFPSEAAAWANLGVLAMRQGNYDLAEDRFNRSLEIEPNHPDLLFLSSIMESLRGDLEKSVGYLRRAVEAEPSNLKIQYALAQELERVDDRTHSNEISSIYDHLINLEPKNRAVILEATRFAAKSADFDRVNELMELISELSEGWENELKNQLEIVTEALEEQNVTELTLEISFLRNMLQSNSRFQDDLLRVELPPTDLGYLIPHFINLPIPEVIVAAPDLEIKFEPLPLELPVETSAWLKGVTLLDSSIPFPVSLTDGELVIDENTQLFFPGETNQPLPPQSVTEIDYNYNFRNDLAMAGSEGFRLYRLNDDETFEDVTSELGLTNTTINRDYISLWAFDIEMDGDLDILLAPRNGSPIVLRNNGDDTFLEIDPFSGLENPRQFLWADLTGDGAPEATFLLENGDLKTFRNLRGGNFDDGYTLAEGIAAIAVGDINADSQFNIISVSNQGNISSHNYSFRTGEWDSKNLISDWDAELEVGNTNLFIVDIDNNGALDLILSTVDFTTIWLGDENRNPVRYENELRGGIVNIFDVNGNDRLDMLGVTENLEPFQLSNEGTKPYFARLIRARASGDLGDQRINSFGIGGEMDIRSGLLYQKALISSPIIHFGLGEYEEAEMLRIIWPNGSVQTEFAELGMGATIFNEQILKGSCPWLFTNDGEEIQFVTDALWRSPLGLRINAQETAGVIQTYDRVKIPGHALKETDGIYDIRITAELWETHFFDYVNLIAVDHPKDTDIYIDERFVFPSPNLSTKIVSKPMPVARVSDQWGNDLTEIVSELNQEYIAPFNKTAYQGLTEEHSIVIELNDNTDHDELYLVMSGWLRPTDSSINLALSQGSIDPPSFMVVEVSDGSGGWKMLEDNFGWPAGKLKTILLDLEGQFNQSEERLVRFTTSAEIYWDSILQAEKKDDSLYREISLEPAKMELRFRGYSVWNRSNSTSPKLPTYSEISSTTQRWRDLEGFHTRFGDVSELLEEIDDRYVIMNAGDEMILHFNALPLPEEGFTRSFVFVSDGWVKDGDYNTEASATVGPLPYHGMADYEYNSNVTIWDDPVFQRYREDWIHYHTRYITPHVFRTAFMVEN